MAMIKRLGLCMMVMTLLGSACKKYADPPPYFEEYGEDSVTTQRKVLIISIDGLSGAQLEKANLPNLQKLTETAKYSYAQLKNVNSTDAASWTTLLTGVGFGKHQIYDSTFQYVPSGDISEGEDESTPYVPNVINYIQQTKPGYKTALITPWQNLAKYVAVADYPYAVNNDASVKDSAVALMRLNTLGVMFLDFNSAELAGNAGKYDISDAGYKGALDKIDGYIGEVVTALKARANYNAEDWLIMITSPRGGSVNEPEPGFVIASNDKLKKEELQKHGFNTVHFSGTGTAGVLAYVPDDNGLYNFGADQDFSFQLQVSVASNASYPGFFGKTDGLSGSSLTGWFLMQEGDHYNVEFGGTNNGGSGKNQISVPTPIVGGKWHTITVSVKMEGGKRTAYCYTDGVFIVSKDITGNKNINAKAPLSMGYDGSSGSATNFHAADIEIFNVALDATTIADNINLKDITKHPYYNNLIGYWPINEGGGGLINNQAPVGYDMMLGGSFVWDGLGADVPVSMTADPSEGISVVPVTEDVVANMFYWLKVEPESSWGLQGQNWLVKFEREIYGL
ncbi:LamG-like jellyroll fold domain-containing protein [Arachidicoccus ginsenosidivorans]